MLTAFQPNAFQNNAYQIVRPATSDLLGGGPGYVYVSPYQRLKEQEYLSEKRAELKALDEKLALAEQHKQETETKLAQAKLADEALLAAKELAALEAMLQAEINRLRNERVWLMRVIDDEETILVILLSQPFIH